MKVKTNKTKLNKSNLPLYLFHQGTNYNAYEYLGAHFAKENGIEGVIFRVWAPNATEVSVVGEFNDWNKSKNVMKRISLSGVFELFIPNLKQYDMYKYAITNKTTVFKADPYAFHSQTPPETASKIYDLDGYCWKDADFIKNKTTSYDKPMNIYEVNLGSWKKNADGSYYSYQQLKKSLVKYVADMGYTHVEFMPVFEYPFDGSWGYQVTGYYSISSRFGTPKDFMELIDEFHKYKISVILDWVPAHFPKDLFGLYMFDGAHCYESEISSRKEHKMWGTHIFDWGKNEVQSFLVSNAIFLFDKFHIDGLRVDAVASMLYLDYDRKNGEWTPNKHGGNYNLEAISFLQKLNTEVFKRYPYALMIAEESTAFPLVTKPVYMGGLGFNYKWNMGWMNDSLSYLSCDPYFRRENHNKLTFSMYYAFSENFVLPISHDEVVHGKKSLIDKAFGDIESKFSSLRTFMLYMMAHPGKKLSFMGNEYGQFREWDYQNGLEFFMLNFDLHKKLKLFNKKLNIIYKENSPLYQIEDSWQGFEWIAVNESENNVYSFIRKDKNDNKIIVILNFSSNNYDNYRLGVDKGKYKMIICTDQKIFGGKGLVKNKIYTTRRQKAHQREYSIKLNLPRFTGAYFVEIKG